MDWWTSVCHLLQNRKLFFSWRVCRICVTSVILAELMFTQLSHTGASVDTGQAPPLHSCLCPLSIQEAPGVQTRCGTSVPGLTPTLPEPHPDCSCQAGWWAATRTSSSVQICFSQNCVFAVSHWLDSLFQSGISGDGCTWKFGMAAALDFLIVSCPWRSPSAAAAAPWLLFLCCPNLNTCSSQSVTVRRKLPADSTAFPCVCGPFWPVSGKR